MFLQRNTASQVFVIPGSLRAVADGSAVTSSATITIVKDGTSGAGAGTLTHISGGAYKYAPTQGETDCKILGYLVEATGAITLAGSIRTTNADPNDAAALGLTRVDAAVSSRMATYTQPTGFLAATFPTTVASTTNITAATGITVATNNDKAGYSLSQSFPSNFASLAITAGGIVQADLQTIKTQTVTCAGGVTVPAATLASTTNITAGTITTVSGVTGLTTSAIADQVWDEILSGHAGAGSAGAALAAAGGSGDPWSTALPGAYGAGTAGYIVGTNIDALITSRMATYTQPTGFLAATFPAAVGNSTYAGADTAGTTTLLSRVTAAVALAGSAPSWYATTGLKLASDGLDSVVVETGINARQAVSAIMASAAGVLSGATTGTIVIKGGGVATTRITATTDADGNRSAITLSLPT